VNSVDIEEEPIVGTTATAPFAVHRPVRGDGPPVWLLHGVYADHALWRAVWERLDGPDVTALDAPGHGTAPRLDPLPSIDALAEELAAQLPGPVLLAGHSWGGMLALRLAVRHPELVRGLLLANTPLLAVRGAGRWGFTAQRALLAAGFPLGAYGRLAAAALYGEEHRRRHPGVVDATRAAVRGLGRRGTREVLRRVLLEPPDAVELLRSVPAPTTVLVGADDYAGTPDVRARVRATGHEVQVHPGGHMGPAEAPEHVARALRDLVRAAVR
jgi:pimeloyl-ACP methyl ester carboxylesterase